ncbi:unnamed protein product, partial [marine sediment metagenome]
FIKFTGVKSLEMCNAAYLKYSIHHKESLSRRIAGKPFHVSCDECEE